MSTSPHRTIKKVIVLGSGMSVLDLSSEEIDHINQCEMVIALNKYMAFYKKVGIMPTHIYFVDSHENSLRFLRYILQVCRQDNLTGLHFIFDKQVRKRMYSNTWQQAQARLFLALFHSLRFFKWYNTAVIKQIMHDDVLLEQLPNNAYTFIDVSGWLDGGEWQTTLSKPLYHFRGSLTTVLNYISIVAPATDIYLIGNDFYGSSYFFDEELEQLNFEWKDFTYDTVKKAGKHFSFQDYQGKKITDVFPFIISSLQKTDNQLFCVNDKSLLVKEAGVTCKKLLT